MKRRVKGFTLTELLVALAISAVLILLLVNVVAAALNAWQQGRNQIDTLASARQALGRITDEIKGAVASAAPNQIEFSENVPALPGTTAPVPDTSENVFFVAPYPNSASGDLCVIAYWHNNATHELQRMFFDSQNAWNAAQKYRSGGYSSLQWRWRTVARGVLEFEIQSYSQSDLDSASPTPTPAQWNSVSGTAAMLGNTPREVVIRMKVIDEKALARIAGLSAGNAVYDRIVNQSAREFTASVLLSAAH
jgi:prepilin-type N-terminal cleavage/methylation domain-containing protein